jgi:hypothetical protein
MSPPKQPPPRKRAATAQARRQQPRAWWIIGGIAVVVAIALVVALVAGTGSKKTSGPDRLPAPPALVAKTTSVPNSVFSTVGVGTTSAPPKFVNGTPLTVDGKPELLYIGAEYCPYCATERWPLVVALSKFGTFQFLKTTSSSSSDVYPNTPTWSFYQSTYSSPYLVFTSVETATRTGAPLETPTAEQLATQKSYDPALTIPFIQFGGKFLVDGATYDPQVLQNKTHDQIATALHDPGSDVAKGAIGTANTMIAAICHLTADQPAKVCGQPGIKILEREMTSTTTPSG